MYRRKRIGKAKKYYRNMRINRGRRVGIYRNPQGYLKLIRRLPEMYVNNSAVANTPVIVDPTSSCLQIGSVTANSWGTYDISFSLQFMLSQILNSTDITTLADKYRIKSAYIRLFFNSTQASIGSTFSMPQIYHITDHDDSSVVPASQIREKMGVKFKTFKAGSYIGIKVNPKPVMNVFNTAVTNGYSLPNRSPWLDAASPNIPHYGVKGVLTNVNLPTTTAANVGFKYDISLVIEAKDFQ